MPLHPFILAGDGSIVILVIVGLIWVFGAVLSKKPKKPQQQRKRSWEEILRDLAGQPQQPPTVPPPTRPMPPPMPPRLPTQMPHPQGVRPPLQMPRGMKQPPRVPMQTQRSPMQAKAPARPMPVKNRPPKRPVPTKIVQAPPPVPAPVAESVPASAQPSQVSLASHITTQNVAETSTPSRRESAPAAKAKAIRKWMSPATLRGQFILTEILRQPLAMREEQ
jgi:hypothetical protein